MGGYALGVDLGTTYTCAAVHRDGRVEVIWLGDRAAVIPSVLYLRPDGEVLVGEAADRRALDDPSRVARGFKRRMGDPAPVLVGGTPYPAEVLTARLLRWVVDRVAEREGGGADAIVLTHPANWGPFKLDLLRQAVEHARIGPAQLRSEPEAAALAWASQERVDAGATVAVYDLGGGTFDAAVLRKAAGGFDLLGTPQGIERLGGVDIDAAVFAHVDAAVDGALSAADPDDPATVAAVARLRRDIVDAKEALSSDVDAAIPITVPRLSHTVRITRGELEVMVRPVLAETIAALRRAIDSSGVADDEVRSVLLVGGSSRIPLVAQLVSAELDRPVAVDAHPKHAVALGAALAAGGVGPAAADADAAPAEVVPLAEPGPVAPGPVAPGPAVSPGRSGLARRPWMLIAAVVAVVAVVGAVLLLTGGDGGDGDSADDTTAIDPLNPPSESPTGRSITGVARFGGTLQPGEILFGQVLSENENPYEILGDGSRRALGVEGYEGFDATLQLLDGDGNEVAFSDDEGGGIDGVDPLIVGTIPEGDTWTAIVAGVGGSGGYYVIYLE